ncbi:MAG: cytochrome c oxidase subunit 3 [Gaiellales bacterium]
MSAHTATVEGPGHAQSGQVSIYHDSLLRSPVFLGMVMFLGSEIMLFGSFFTAFFYNRFTHHPWPPPGIEIPKKPTAINTAILISSSFTMHWALVSIKRGRRFGLVVGLFLTLAMGLTFLSLQIHEYVNLNFKPDTNAFSSGFFALTGLHGAHVFVGATLLTIAFVRSVRGHYSSEAHLGLEVTGLYWHFVDVVWVALYTVVYLL